MSYRVLSSEKTISTIGRLRDRIGDRFPDSGLYKVCTELFSIATDSVGNIERIGRPNIFLRSLVGLFLAFCIAAMVYSTTLLNIKFHAFDFTELVTLLEASINDLLLMGAAIFFLFTIEGRIKRRRALKALQELRTIAHVIDMHQLSKDPLRRTDMNTENSPIYKLTPFELGRYLDYCSEMLSLTGKLAALYANGSGDDVVLRTIDEVEELTTGLSRKIWQKIMILNARTES